MTVGGIMLRAVSARAAGVLLVISMTGVGVMGCVSRATDDAQVAPTSYSRADALMRVGLSEADIPALVARAKELTSGYSTAVEPTFNVYVGTRSQVDASRQYSGGTDILTNEPTLIVVAEGVFDNFAAFKGAPGTEFSGGRYLLAEIKPSDLGMQSLSVGQEKPALSAFDLVL
jgi:hypothetical protein